MVVVDLVDEPGEEFLASGLAVVGGVVVLGGEGWPELDAGLEVAAGFADGLEGAVELGRAGAVAVAEEAVVLAAEPVHAGSGGVGGELGGLTVEGFDFLADGEVLISDGAAGDFRIPQGHVQAAVAEQGGDRFQAHPAVDGLGGQSVTQLMRVNVGQAGGGARPG